MVGGVYAVCRKLHHNSSRWHAARICWLLRLKNEIRHLMSRGLQRGFKQNVIS